MNATNDSRMVRFVRAWTRFYTRGLSPETAAVRRDEIDSDLWEHARSGPSSLQVLGRWLLGVPADLIWRAEQVGAGGRQRSASGLTVRTSGLQKGMIGLTFAVGLFLVGMGVAFIVTGHYNQESTSDTPAIALGVYGGVPILAGLLITLGVFDGSRRPRRSAWIIAAGVLLIGLLWFWLFMFTIPLGILIIGSALARSRRLTSDRA